LEGIYINLYPNLKLKACLAMRSDHGFKRKIYPQHQSDSSNTPYLKKEKSQIFNSISSQFLENTFGTFSLGSTGKQTILGG